MKQAFLILAHKNLEQVKFLADSIIDAADNSVYIHVDAKSNDLHAELALYYSNDCRVTIIGDRQCVYWADFSQVKATLNLLTKAAQAKYDYFSLISAQDYPIKPLEQFNSFLAKDRGREFIEARIRNNTWRVKLAHRHIRHPRFRKYRYYRYYALLLSLINYRPKQYVNQYKIYFGSQWFTITQDAVSFILKFVESNPGFMADFASSTCGDEHFFQTILMNSDFKTRVANDNLRFIKFKLHRNSPTAIAIEDLKEMDNSSKFIARKFDPDTDREILLQLRERCNAN